MTLKRDFYIPKGAKKIVDPNTDALAYVNDWECGTKYTAMVFAGKRNKYDNYYGFKTAEKRDNYVQEYFEGIANQYANKKALANKQKAKAATNQDKYKVGDILYTAWGYDQTNIDFYQIVNKTKAMATIRPIKGYIAKSYQGYNDVMPQKDNFAGGEMTKKIGTYGLKIHSFANADLWDGRPKHQTATGWGH